MRKIGKLDDHEMYRTFNMGIGLIMIVPAEAVASMREALIDYPAYPLYEIGRVVRGEKTVRLS